MVLCCKLIEKNALLSYLFERGNMFTKKSIMIVVGFERCLHDFIINSEGKKGIKRDWEASPFVFRAYCTCGRPQWMKVVYDFLAIEKLKPEAFFDFLAQSREIKKDWREYLNHKEWSHNDRVEEGGPNHCLRLSWLTQLFCDFMEKQD